MLKSNWHRFSTSRSENAISGYARPHPDRTAIELRSADFSPHPSSPAKTVGSGLKSALLSCRNSLNSMAVLSGSLPARASREEREPGLVRADGVRVSVTPNPKLFLHESLAGQNIIVIRAVGGYKSPYNTNSKTHD